MKSLNPRSLVISPSLLSITLLLAFSVNLRADSFTPSCTLDPLMVARPVDSKCGAQGASGETPATQNQNSAKNNLCSAGTSVPITISLFDDLQQAAEANDVPFGNQHIPHPVELSADRSVLKDLATVGTTSVGEGTKVVFVAFVLNTKAGGAESVNCEFTGVSNNDIHIILSNKFADTDECNSVTAEMVPHFRPQSWEKMRSQVTTAVLKKHPVRVTGQMFFDASHAPCNHPDFRLQGDPKRRSLWEIHPVYALDVCKNKTLAGCKVDKESVWTAFDQWVKNPK